MVVALRSSIPCVAFSFVSMLQGFMSYRLKIHAIIVLQRGLKEEKHVSEADVCVGEKCRNKDKQENITAVAPSPPSLRLN